MKYLVCVSCSPNSEQEQQAIVYCKSLSLEQHKTRIFFFGKAATCPYQNFSLWMDIFDQANIDYVVCSQSLKHFSHAELNAQSIRSENQVNIAGLGTLVEGAVQAGHIINFSNHKSDQTTEGLENNPAHNARECSTYLIADQEATSDKHNEALKRAIDSLNVFLAFNQKACLIIHKTYLDYLRKNNILLSMAQELGLTQLAIAPENTEDNLDEASNVIEEPIRLNKEVQILVKRISNKKLNTIKKSFKYISYN